MRRAAILVAFLATGALAVPTGERYEAKCATQCAEQSPYGEKGAPLYKPGSTHVFDYTADVVTTLAGATDEESRLHVTATAEVTANTACDLTLQLKDVSLQDSDPKDARSRQNVDDMATFKQELERFKLHFSYNYGSIMSLCSNPDEPVWVLNFKRGVLSTLITAPSTEPNPRLTTPEEDVSGRCLADYVITEHGSSTMIKKEKDLMRCSGRGHLVSSLQATPYAGETQSKMPLLKSTLECEQKVTEGRLVSSVCRESHLFKPFSQEESGAVTRTTTTLTERTVRDAGKWFWQGADDEMPTVRRRVTFDHSDAELTQKDRVPAAAELLRQLQQNTADDVRADVPRLFTRLVNMLRHFSEEGLVQLESQLEAGSAAQRYFVDALPLAGSAPALSVMRDMILRGRVDDETTDRWMTALAFVHEPTLEMVSAVAPLLEGRSARRQTLLGISSMVHHYCKSHSSCSYEAPVRTVVGHLERRLGAGCQAASEDEEMLILTALKALGNAGRLVDGGSKLRKCFQDDENSMAVRLAAIQAFRRMPCDAVVESGLMKTFTNAQEDTELRIAAYLAVMKCPSNDMVDKVKEILSTETVNQVNSFVWSHINNDPNNADMKSQLYGLDLASKFSSGISKISRYFEKTMFSESMNAGATVGASVIFAPDSYIPRSGMFNLTVDMFGDAFNLLEVGGRAEGLEDLSESLFGNSGIYPQETISQMMKTMQGRSNALSTGRIQSSKASVYMKVFGNELRFGKYDTLKELVASMGAKNPLDFLQKLAKDMDWTENYQFLDSSYTVPTIAGFPFTLKATGAATLSLKTGGSFDVQSWSKVNIDGHIKPSAAVEIMGEMLVDAHVAHTGLKMNTNLHTSTILDGHAIVDGGKLVSVRVNMPRDKVEILDVSTRFHSVFRNKARKLEMFESDRYELKSCSDEYISTALLGINLCADVSYSRGAPSCLLSGPMTARFTVEKTDTLKAFEFEYQHSNEQGIRKSTFVIDTVGSAIDRRISADYTINFETSEFQAGFHTPIKSMDVSGALDLAGRTKRADISLKMDDVELFGIASSLAIEDTTVTVRYTPSLSIRSAGYELANFQGNLIANKNKHKYSVDLAITKVFQTPLVFKGAFNNADGTSTVTASMESFILDGNMKGTFRMVGDNLLIQTNTQYSFAGGEPQTIAVNAKMSKDESDEETTCRLFVDTKFSGLPVLDSQLRMERRVTSDTWSASATLIRGERTYELSTEMKKPRGEETGSATIGFAAPHWDVDFKLGISADMSKQDRMMVSGIAQLNKEYFANTKVELDYKSVEEGWNYGVKAELALPSSTYMVNTGIRSEANGAHLRVMGRHETSESANEVALVGALSTGSDELGVEVTLSLPYYPRYEVSARLVPGSEGLYLVRVVAQAGERAFTAGAELNLARSPAELQLVLELPGSPRWSAHATALVTGPRPEVTVDLRFGRRVTAVLAGNLYPSENTGNFEIFWNKDVDDTQKASVEVLLRDLDASASLKYPGREIKFVSAIHGDTWTADLQYAPGKMIRAEGNVPYDESLLQASVTTPFSGYSTMSLTFTMDQRADSAPTEFHIVGRVEDQEARLDGHLRLGPAIEMRLELFTPFAGWEKNLLKFRYLLDTHSFDGRILAAKNDDEVGLGVSFEMLQEEVFKIHTAVDFALPLESLRKGKAGFDLKFSENNLDAGVLVNWKDFRMHEMSLSLSSQHSVGLETHIDSQLVLHTPFEGFETMSSHLKYDHDARREARMHILLNFKHADTKVINTELLVSTNDVGQSTAKFVFSCTVCPLEIIFNGNAQFSIGHESIDASISATHDGKEASLSFKFDGTTPQESSARSEYSVTLVWPTLSGPYSMAVVREMNMAEQKASEQVEIKWGEKTIASKLNMEWDVKTNSEGNPESLSITGNGELTTPFQDWTSITIAHTSKVTNILTQPSYKGYTKYVNSEGKAIEVTDRMNYQDIRNWLIQREIVSESQWVSSASHTLKVSGTHANFQLTASSEKDGANALFEYSHECSDIQLSASLKAKWFGGVTRGLKLALRNAEEAIYPAIDVTRNDTPVYRLYGSITKSLGKGQSSVTVETPFTERAILSVEHEFDYDSMKVTVDYLHGNKRYVLDVDASSKRQLMDAVLAIKFSSPITCMGEASTMLKYEWEDNELKLKGMMTLNDWKFSMKSSLATKKGYVTVNTPYAGYTKLSVSYLGKGDEGEIRLKREEDQILVVVNQVERDDSLTYNMRVNTPFSGYEVMTLAINMPFFENKVNAEYQRGRFASISVNTEFEVSGPLFWVTVEAQSSLDGFSTAGMHIGYNALNQEAKFALSKENEKLETKFVVALSALHSELSVEHSNTLIDIGLPQELTVTGMYNLLDVTKSLELTVIKGTEKFGISAETQATPKLTYFTVNVATPIEGYEAAKLDARLENSYLKSVAMLEVSKNEDIIKAICQLIEGSDVITASAALHTPFDSYRVSSLSAEYRRLEQDAGYVQVIAERNSDRYQIKLAVESKDQNTRVLVLTTPFTGFERLSAEGSLVVTDNTMALRSILARNEDEISLAVETEISWSKSVLSVDVKSPFAEVRSLGVTAMYDIQGEQKTSHMVLDKNGKQYGMSVFVNVREGGATGLVELKTPIKNWESVKYQAIYDLTSDDKLVEFSSERNGIKKVLSGRGSYDGETAYFDVVTPIEGYETVGVNGRYVNKRGKREAGYEAHVNDHRHRLHVLYERSGLDSATLKIETPIEGMHSIHVDARSQEFPNGKGYYITTNRDGKRNQIDIRTTSDENSIGVDIGIKSYVEGLENVRLTGSIVTRGRKRAFSFKSARAGSEAEISGEVVMKRRSGEGKLKIAVPMLEEWGDVDAVFNYDLGPTKSFSLTSTRGGVTREYSGSLQYSDTALAITLNTPFDGFEKLSVDASRTTSPDGTISAEIKLMRGDRKIEISYDYNLSGGAGSGNVKVLTPYEGFRKSEAKLRYDAGEKSRSFEFRAQRGERIWHIQTSRNWDDGVDSASLELHTPLEEIRELKINRGFNFKNLKAMTYEAAYERNGKKFSLSGTGSLKRKGKKANFDVTISTPLEIGNLGAKIEYDFAGRAPWTMKAKLTAGNRYATLTASVGADAGSISLVTTNEKLPKVDIAYTADISEAKRAVQASLTLFDGRKAEIDYLADYSKQNKANGHLYVQSTTYGDRKLTWDAAWPNDDFAGNLKYTSPNGNLDWSVTLDGKQFVQRKLVVKSSIQSEIYTSEFTLTARYNRKNGFSSKNRLVYNGKDYSLNIDFKNVDGKYDLSVIYNGQILKGIKIDANWTPLLDNPFEKKEFVINYKRGSKTGSLQGSYHISSEGESGTVNIDLETSYEEVKSLTLKTSWDFVLPNRILKIEIRRNNDRTWSLDFVGSRSEENGKAYGQYSCTLITPEIPVDETMTIPPYTTVQTFAFDLRYGTMLKSTTRVSTTQGEIASEEYEIDIREAGNVRTVVAKIYYKSPGFLLEGPVNWQIDFNSKRTDRPVGPKIDLRLTTNFEGYEDIEVHIDVSKGSPKSTIQIDYRRGSRRGALTLDVTKTATGAAISVALQTPIEGFEQVSITGSVTTQPEYALTLDYSRGDKFVKVTATAKYDYVEAYGQPQSGSGELRLKWDSYITKRTDLLVTLESSVETKPRLSSQVKVGVTLNGDSYSAQYQQNYPEAGRRTARLVIVGPKGVFPRTVYSSDVSLLSNKADVSLEYGKKKFELNTAWFAGEARQYGAELRLVTPYKIVQNVELDAKATLHSQDDGVDVLVHYRRGEKMVHVTGQCEPFACDLHFETPTFGNFGVKAGYTTEGAAHKVEVLVTLASGKKIGGSFTGKPVGQARDLQFGLDIHSPWKGFERINAEIAYTNIKDSNIVRVAFESPMTKRVELAFELTNLSSPYGTDFRAGVTTNYLGNAFTFKTSILRDQSGMKYELEIESPFHILPSFKITGRR